MSDAKLNGAGAKLRHYDVDFKKHAVELTLQADRTIRSVGKELGVPTWALYRWRRQYAPSPMGRGGSTAPRTLEASEEDVRLLRAEIIRLREREIILKKSLGILSETPERSIPKSRS